MRSFSKKAIAWVIGIVCVAVVGLFVANYQAIKTGFEDIKADIQTAQNDDDTTETTPVVDEE